MPAPTVTPTKNGYFAMSGYWAGGARDSSKGSARAKESGLPVQTAGSDTLPPEVSGTIPRKGAGAIEISPEHQAMQRLLIQPLD